ncbi:MAG: hypothetical protein GXP54_12185 [Deltaproteobacteria bacterium]|nr:hypothetical protein [Deltaproteobacteria bacterium]
MRSIALAMFTFIVAGCTTGGSTPDALSDSGPESDIVGDATEASCTPVEQGVLTPKDTGPTKFALAVFHFNLQYVAGGLKGFVPPDQDPDGIFDYDNEQLEDRIITESFEPVLDIFLAHPRFAGDMEMQGYMLDVMADRHPGVIEKMRTLVQRGQIAVQSFHWSDQLYNAHSRWSMERSIQLNEAAFERVCLPHSPAVFTQEGQFSEGMLELMKQQGQSIGIMKAGLFNYQYKDVPIAPLYTLRGQDVVVARGLDIPGLKLTWYFVDDGEVAVTNDTNPYLGTVFQYYPEAGDKLIKQLDGLLDDGYFLTTVDDYVKRIKQMGFKAEKLPYSLDGNWRPDDAHNFFTWMGDAGLFGADEADNAVLTSLEGSRITVQAAEAVLNWAESGGVVQKGSDLDAGLAGAIRDQILGEVSDSTGWNPWRGEVEYALNHSRDARSAAVEIIDSLKNAAETDGFVVDLAGPTVTKGAVFPENPWTKVEQPPMDAVVEAAGFDVTTGWEKWTQGAPDGYDLFRLSVTLDRKEADASDMTITFPRSGDRLVYTPAMLDDEVADIPLADLPGYDGSVNVPAANGLVGLGDGRFLIKDVRSFHLSAFFPFDEKVVYFRDRTLSAESKYHFFIYVLTGATKAQALKEAVRFNVNPIVIF